MKFGWKKAVVAVVVLAIVHTALALLPGAKLSPGINLALFATNLYVLYCASFVLGDQSGRSVVLFALGYLALFLLLMVVLDRKPLFILLVVLYASVFRSRFLLGFFGIFVLSFVVLQPYSVESFVPLALIYVALSRVPRAPRFLKIAFGLGLLALTLVLFPILHLGIQDSAQTLWHTLKRPDVLEAIGLSLGSSAIATLVIALWGVPLAYALARLDFSGRRFLEAVIDLPILIPQSVAGIALMVLFGPGSPIGNGLNELFGVQVAGRMLGIVIAQVFVASPFLIKAALGAFEAVPLQLEMASRTLGASPARTFWRISLPLAGRGLFVGGTLAFARAVSEFGAIILFAASPVTAPVLVHNEFLRAGVSESRPIAVLLLMVCLWIFVLLQFGATYIPFGHRPARGRS